MCTGCEWDRELAGAADSFESGDVSLQLLLLGWSGCLAVRSRTFQRPIYHHSYIFEP